MNRSSAKGIVQELGQLAGDWRQRAKEGPPQALEKRNGIATGLDIAAGLVAERFDVKKDGGA